MWSFVHVLNLFWKELLVQFQSTLDLQKGMSIFIGTVETLMWTIIKVYISFETRIHRKETKR